MTADDSSAILTAIGDLKVSVGRVETEIKNLAGTDTKAEARLDAHSARLDKLERIAYVALGIAIASGAPPLVSVLGR